MKIKELVEARDYTGAKGWTPDVAQALPNSHIFPELDNSSGYLAYRFGIAMAGLPDHKMDVAGPTGLKMVTIGYTDVEDSILQAAANLVGTPKVQLTPGGSHENKDVSTTSPVNNWNAKKTTKRTKKD